MVPAHELMVSLYILMTRERKAQVHSLWGKQECVHERRKKARNPTDYQLVAVIRYDANGGGEGEYLAGDLL